MTAGAAPGPTAAPGAPARPPALALRLERAVAALLGLYILAQCFGVPLLGAGPWALWPTLADLTFWAALACAALYRCPVAPALWPVWRALVATGLLALAAGALLLVMGDGHLGVALGFGAFELYKLFQLTAVFWMAGRLDLTPQRLNRWLKAAQLGYLLMVVSVVWTYLSDALPTTLGQVLPRGQGSAGPWEAFYRYNEQGLGLIGYNHAYVAAALLLQAAFLMVLRPQRPAIWILMSLVIASFLSGARAGLVGALLFALLEGRRTPLRSATGLLVLATLAVFAAPLLGDSLDTLIARQSTILDAGNSDNLAGRTDIWRAYLGALATDPARLLLGSGLGSGVANMGANAHMLILHVLYQTGVVGLTVFLGLFAVVIRELWRRGTASSRVMLSLLIGLWSTSFAAETFYPNTAFGSFLPMLMLVLVVALRAGEPARGGHT